MNKNGIPILVYHRISAENTIRPMNEDEFYAVTAANFRQQMEYLKAERYTVVGLEDLLTNIKHQGSSIKDREMNIKNTDARCWMLDSRPKVVITFDDGRLDNYTTVFPILKELGLKAHFFVIASKIATPGYMNWQQLKELKEGGMVVGSHGMTHCILKGLTENDLDYEFRISKQLLEDHLGFTVDYLSIPRGFYNERIIKIAKEAGYHAVCTSDFGLNCMDTDLFRLRRIAVISETGIEDFKKLYCPGNLALIYRRLSAKGRYVLKNIIGQKNYTALKEILIRKVK